MGLRLRQLGALLWKCFLLRKRHKFTTFFEIIFPLLSCVVVLLIIRKSSQGSGSTKVDATIHNESERNFNFINPFGPEPTVSPGRRKRQLESTDDFELSPNYLLNYPIDTPVIFARDDSENSTNSNPDDTTKAGSSSANVTLTPEEDKKAAKNGNVILYYDEIYVWPDNQFSRKITERMKRKFQFYSKGRYNGSRMEEAIF